MSAAPVPATTAGKALHPDAFAECVAYLDGVEAYLSATVASVAERWDAVLGACGDPVRFGDSVAVLVGDAARAIAEDLAAGDVALRVAWRER